MTNNITILMLVIVICYIITVLCHWYKNNRMFIFSIKNYSNYITQKYGNSIQKHQFQLCFDKNIFSNLVGIEQYIILDFSQHNLKTIKHYKIIVY